jgi:hypothetical protein
MYKMIYPDGDAYLSLEALNGMYSQIKDDADDKKAQ